MMQHNYKDLPLSLIHCDDPDVYTGLVAELEVLFADVSVEATTEQVGEALSTCRVPGTLDKILTLPRSENFYNWIESVLVKHSELLIGKQAESIKFTRAWANKMFRGCEGGTHLHKSNCDGVAVFYLKVPENGAKLTLIKGCMPNTRVSDYPENRCASVDAATGDLVFHRPSIPHAVSKHNSDEERICLVFEFVYN